MKGAKLIKRSDIAEQEKRKRVRITVAPVNTTRQVLTTVNSWVKQKQNAQASAYQAFAALFAES